ncbi:pentatricopeptide repeat-containing protein At5g65560 [Sesamum indicum]|uniref:Pentatricopeptide repeat-containing protein At5g65560 n=1 Tax=Sesamum indicum TaxID=4182 RepID=A0A6I9U9E1_SESIN|nr:pentatricopeptide repeat-containing protein At5g65560 [Sesamum indicum]
MNHCDDGDFGFKLGLRCYNMLLMLLARFLMINDMKCVYRDMLDDKAGLKPNTHTYTSFILGHCRRNDLGRANGMLDEARKILGTMRDNRPNVRTYNELISGFCEGKNVHKALLSQMLEEKISPDLCNLEKVDCSLALFERMVTESCLPNSYTYNVLINGLCKVKKLAEALEYLARMLEAGMKPTIVTYSIIIDQILKEFDFDSAYKVLTI